MPYEVTISFKHEKYFLALGQSLCPYILDVTNKESGWFVLYKLDT